MNSVLKIFNYRFYLKEFLIVFFCYLFLEGIFSWLFVPVSIVVLGYEKILGFIIYGFMLYIFPRLKPVEKFYIAAFTLFLIKLVVESLNEYNSFFQQLTMYYVLFPIVFTLFIKYVSRTFDLDLLEFIAKFYLLAYIFFMVIYGRGFSFSLDAVEMDDYGPFSGDGRVVHARSVFMMIIPLLWYLNQFITTRKNKFLIPFVFCVGVILMHQHRSVWSSSLVAMAIYFIGTSKINSKRLFRILSFAGGAIIAIGVVYFFASNLFPSTIDFLADRFGEIFNPAKEGSTGNFRIEQREVYGKMFLQKPLLGWSFKGFEMPNPLVDWWPEKSGQHFHEGYMEMLFYHGILGFLLKYSFLFYILYMSFSRKLTQQTVIMVSFCVSSLLFSFNYVLPLIFWGHVGVCLYYIEKDLAAYKASSISEEIIEEPEFEEVDEVDELYPSEMETVRS